MPIAGLSSLDDQTSAMYYAIVGESLPAATLSAVKSAQVKFLQQRDSCGADVNCLVDAYTSQITYFKQTEKELPPSTGDWATFTSPTSGFSISYPRGYTVDPAPKLVLRCGTTASPRHLSKSIFSTRSKVALPVLHAKPQADSVL